MLDTPTKQLPTNLNMSRVGEGGVDITDNITFQQLFGAVTNKVCRQITFCYIENVKRLSTANISCVLWLPQPVLVTMSGIREPGLGS